MHKDYSFLQDELALVEIRKHKWLESQKERREIGFATAAVDWVRKYGTEFKNFRLASRDPGKWFEEKRLYRRFSYKAPINLGFPDSTVTGYITDFNLIGLACTVPQELDEEQPTDITIDFADFLKKPVPVLRFRSHVARAVKASDASSSEYKVFIPFSEKIRNYLRVQLQDN